MLYSDYILDLKDFPAWMIADACKKYRQNAENKFFPRVAQLIALIKPQWYEMTHKLKTIEKLIFAVGDFQKEEERLTDKDWQSAKVACETPEEKPVTPESKAQRTIAAMRQEGAAPEDIIQFAQMAGVQLDA